MTIDLTLGPDQSQIIASVQDVLADRCPLSRFRGQRGGQHDDAALAELAQLGWFGMGIAEQHGGAGFTLVEDVLLFRELGRHLVTPTVLASSLAAHAALTQGQAELAGAFADGSVRACLAQGFSSEGAEAGSPVEGLITFDAARAQHLVFWNSDGLTVLPASRIASLAPMRCIDRTVSLHRAAVVAGPGETGAASLQRRADLLVAAQLLGIAEGALELAVAYAKLRHQFGQAIGGFQAIKHRCADMKVRTKVLGSLVLMAALCERDGRGDADLQIASARLLASRYALDNAAAGIQIHGAMGFTAECDAHLYLLRAHLLATLGATASELACHIASLPA